MIFDDDPNASTGEMNALLGRWLESNEFDSASLGDGTRTPFTFLSSLFEPTRIGSGTFSECSTFRSLPADAATALEQRLQPVRFAAGEFLLRQNAPGDSLLLIDEGVVQIDSVDDADERVDLARIGPGDVLGEMALLTNEPRSASAVAVTDVSARTLPVDVFHELAVAHPALSQVLTDLVATRLGGGPRDALAGKSLHGYRIRGRLGRGGMSVVYEATHAESHERVALKMMSHRLVYDADAVRRFQREADLIAAFDHPRIVRTKGRFAAFHTCFIVLEFVDGRTLAEVVAERAPLPLLEARRILGQAASALAYAHRAGVVHRDIKPGNIMVSRDGAVRMMDFGLAQPVAELQDGQDGLVVGTPRYMAPEQLLLGRTSPASDLFGLGCVAYELIAGRPLIPERELGEIVRRHMTWNAAPFGDLCPQARGEVADALDSILHPKPSFRRVDLDAIARWADG